MARASGDDVIVLGARRRQRLEAIVAKASAPQRLVLRAKIVLAAWRREPLGIRASQIGRILASLDLKPHRVHGWLNRPADPQFHLKAQAVCRLYLDPPADTVLFSVDEKTSMQAKSRTRPTRPIRPGQHERREFEYVRHGTVSLMAAMNVTTGTVHPKIINRNDSVTFIEFLTGLAQTVEPAKKIHLILDNGSSHTSTQTRQWLRDHPRFTVTYTPTHASWLNMVEIFFSILTRRMLRRGDFASRTDLAEKIIKFIDTYNDTAKPFRWTYDVKLLKAA